VGHAVRREEAERPIQPCGTPPLPTETVTLAGPHQMVPNLLLDPVSNEEKHRLEWPIAKYCTQPRRIGLICAITSLSGRDRWLRKICLSVRNSPSLFHPRGAKRHPSVSPTANPTEVKAEKSEALALREVHPSTLLLVHLDLERRQFLSKSPFDRRTEPALARMSCRGCRLHLMLRPACWLRPKRLSTPRLGRTTLIARLGSATRRSGTHRGGTCTR
jgi:hypothetical protein